MNRYLTVMHYAATGEGQIYEIKTLTAANKQEACIKHMTAFQYTKEEKAYYGIGIEALLVTNTRVEEIINGTFNQGDKLISAIRRGTADIHMKLVQNES